MEIAQSLKKIWNSIKGKRKSPDRQKAMAAFRRRYISFKQLLQANADLAQSMAVLGNAQDSTVSTRVVRKQARRALLLCKRMIDALNAISGNRYTDLNQALEKIAERVEAELRQHAKGDLRTIVASFSELDSSMAYIVGGKSANLGEASTRLNMRIPRGFAVTIKAGTIFLLRNGDLMQKIYAHLAKIDPDKPHTIRAAARAIERLVSEAPVPPALLDEMLKAWDNAFGEDSATILAALRSSAVSEDGAQSFAGQYESVLGVSRATLPDAIRKVIGSLFSERALAYRAAHGYALDAIGMGLCCLEMIEPKAAGVAFSRHPVDLRSNCAVINAVPGLGENVVDGTSPCDQWLVSRANGKIRDRRIADKHFRSVCSATGASRTEALDAESAHAPSLTDEQVGEISQMALDLEHHYHYPQDIEWAIDQEDRLFLLQTRPLGLDAGNADYEEGKGCPLPGTESIKPLIYGGDVASRGVAFGPVVHVHPNQEPAHFPDGAILVAQNSTPNLMTVLRKAGALLAEAGSLTGHLASVCREFAIPAVFNLPGVYALLKDGQQVTVDALAGRVFDGEVPQLLELRRPPVKSLPNTPALALLRRLNPWILPLHLIDPHSENFKPENCSSLHDIMRYAHEKSYTEMFALSDTLSESGIEGAAARMECAIPIDLYVIDLGGGLKEKNLSVARPEDVASLPFATLLKGMLNPELVPKGPRPVNMRGFLSVMSQSMIGGNLRAGERFGDRSYAIISDRYLNFSSRVGYHYAILDSWCGDTINKNYIRFEFAGGAAGDEQRARRARCIGLILGELGFTVEVSHDRIRARFQKYPRLETAARLDQLGRLLIMTRQMDMLMVNEESVRVFADKFLNGEYH